jgi:hypothetical protein
MLDVTLREILSSAFAALSGIVGDVTGGGVGVEELFTKDDRLFGIGVLMVIVGLCLTLPGQ